MRRTLILGATALALNASLAACSKPASPSGPADAAAPPASAASAPSKPTAAARSELAAKSDRPPAPPVTLPQLAYRYAETLEAPAGAIRGLVDRHEAACQAAGPAVCQLTGAQVEERGKDRVHGELTLKATAAWLKAFRAGLAHEAEAAGGRVANSTVATEDLSRQIVDTEAAIRARTALRDRLQNLLANHPGKLSDLLQVEGELARVQGEIDATQSELTDMRGRVATSELKLTYESTGVLAPQGVLAPLGKASGDALGLMVMMVAGMIRFAAVLAPVAVVAGLVFWLARSRLARRAAPPPAA